jgi:RecB family endonuclease NucS
MTCRRIFAGAVMLALLAALTTVFYDRTERHIDSVQRFVVCKPDGTLAPRYECP